MNGHCSADPALGGRVLVGLEIIDLRWCQQRVESLKLAEADIEVWIDENIGWADGAVRTATSM